MYASIQACQIRQMFGVLLKSGVLILLATPSAASTIRLIEVPTTADEDRTLIQFARSELPSDYSTVEFDSISIGKTEVEHTIGKEDPKIRKRERLTLYGVFPDSHYTEEYRERYAIECTIKVQSVDGEILEEQQECVQGIERLLTYEGVESELLLDEDVNLRLAKAFLDFLSSQIGSTSEEPVISFSDFSSFKQISYWPGSPDKVSAQWSVSRASGNILFCEVNEGDGYQFECTEVMTVVADRIETPGKGRFWPKADC